MSDEHRAVTTELVDAINRRDQDRLSTPLHPQFEFQAAIGAVEQRAYEGKGGLSAFVSDMDTRWEDYRIELLEVREAGERAVAVMRIRGRARISGVPLDQEIAQVITWRDGRIWRVVAYLVPADALKAVGLAE